MSFAPPQLPSDFGQFLAEFKSNKFTKLWPAQADFLGRYKDFISESDLGLELPTGAGKTLIALVLAETWRAAGKKVAILSANKTLARQMTAEAQVLGIPAVLMQGKGTEIPGADKRAYQRAQKVGIMNYWVYFNQGPVIDPADLLIMDDAHLAEHCLHSLFSFEINKHEHEELFHTVVAELRERFPEYSVLTDALATDVPGNTSPELLSFFDQQTVVSRFREIVDASPTLSKDSDLKFRWGRIRSSLAEANVYLGMNTVWVRPYIYPLISWPHYAESSQRLYVSATIGDPSDLSRRLGVRQITKVPVDPTFAEKTSGRRLVVMNRIEDADIPARIGRAILTALKTHPKSVWLCSSRADAQKYKDAVTTWLNKNGFVGHPSWLLSSLGDEIDEFKASAQGHLFVAGRFDGMDFKADECRLVVVTTLPRAIDVQEEFICAYLRDSGFMRRRLNQRLVQALGRCNRGDDDFGVYVLADRRFATHFGRESNREGIPRNMIAEIDMAQDNADLDDVTLSEKVSSFLTQDFAAYDADLIAYQQEVPPTKKPTFLFAPEVTQAEVMGWAALFGSHNYALAADRFEEVWDAYLKANVIEMGAFQKWLWAKAVSLQSTQDHPTAKARAFELADEAIKRGGQASWFNRLRASLNRARSEPTPVPALQTGDYASALIRAFDDHLEQIGSKNRFEKFIKSVSESLAGDKHQQYCEGLEKLGALLGYQAKRPKGKAATDNRWRGTFAQVKEAITFEVKIEHEDGNAVTPTHMGQAHNQLNRAVAEFSSLGYTIRGTVVTHLQEIEPSASSSAGPIRILRKEAISALWNRVHSLLAIYREGWSLDDVAARQPAATALYAKCPPDGWLSRVLDTDELFVGAEGLLKEWPGAIVKISAPLAKP
jgi:Helicase C-terminal domain